MQNSKIFLGLLSGYLVFLPLKVFLKFEPVGLGDAAIVTALAGLYLGLKYIQEQKELKVTDQSLEIAKFEEATKEKSPEIVELEQELEVARLKLSILLTEKEHGSRSISKVVEGTNGPVRF